MPNSIFNNKNIAFFNPRQDFATNPSLLCLTEEFIKHNAHVDVYMPGLYMRGCGRYPPLEGNISQYPFPRKLEFWAGEVGKTLSNWKWYFVHSSWKAERILKEKKYDLVFGIDSEGIIAAYQYASRNRVPIVYICYEIIFRDELLRRSDYKEKDSEIKASQRADMVIIQDKWRAKLLADENNLDEQQFIYLPVSPRSSSTIQRTNYLRKRFNIPNGKIVVLHSGSFEDWTYAEELIDSVPKWPEKVVLVIHTRYSPVKKHKYISRIQENNFENIILSTEPLYRQAYEQMVASADIGLVLYKKRPVFKSLQKNIETIGFSSGKFSYYMKYGLPVIAAGGGTYHELLKEYHFGISLNSFDEMPEALSKVISCYQKHSDEAKRLFSEKLAFDLYWPATSRKLAHLLRSRNHRIAW